MGKFDGEILQKSPALSAERIQLTKQGTFYGVFVIIIEKKGYFFRKEKKPFFFS